MPCTASRPGLTGYTTPSKPPSTRLRSTMCPTLDLSAPAPTTATRCGANSFSRLRTLTTLRASVALGICPASSARAYLDFRISHRGDPRTTASLRDTGRAMELPVVTRVEFDGPVPAGRTVIDQL